MSLRLTDEQRQRYARHFPLPEVGEEGQLKLLSSSVLVVGAGGLGSPCSLYLAAAGVGRIGLLDSDSADLTNLQRQILHGTPDVGRPKVESGRESLLHINPDIEVVALQQKIETENALDVIREWDVVVDGSDNFPTKFLLNDACVLSDKPLIHAGVLQHSGQIMTILPRKGPCYRCIFPEPPPDGLVPTCVETGLLGVVPGVLGVIEAAEVLKFLLGIGDLLVGRMLIYDLLESGFREVAVPRDEDCPVCGKHPTITGLTNG